MYLVEFTTSAKREFLRLDEATRRRLRRRLLLLAEWPNRSLDVRPLRGKRAGQHRLRGGGYRVIFVVDEQAQSISLREIGPRGRFY